ncbi:MAG: hypothetical protein QOG23_1362 [Blastocatellia bacterium]|jgi:hypothetical protein|nr:hypothetical protein [Blastocatellia bacterium]
MSQFNWGSIVGVVVGFLLGQVANVTGWLISSRKEKRLSRLLVALEINQNLALLRDYWHNVALPPNVETDKARGVTRVPEIEADRLARRAVEIPLPVMSNKALNSQLAVLPKALDEKTIRLTWHLYEQLDQVVALHAWLVEIMSNSSDEEEEFPSASRAIRVDGLESMTFRTKTAGAIFDLRTTVQKLLKAGNPLKLPPSDE